MVGGYGEYLWGKKGAKGLSGEEAFPEARLWAVNGRLQGRL